MIQPQLHKTYQPRVSYSGIIQSKKKRTGEHEPKYAQKKADVEICLNCTRAKCCGTQKCFAKMKGENADDPD